jgi:hypothetical protein
MSDPMRFREVDPDTFSAAWEKAVHAVRERPPLTQAEIDAGWRHDASGLRWNIYTDEWDDTYFIHLAPRRLSGRAHEREPEMR